MKKILQSSSILAGISFFQRALGLITLLILTRLLTKEDFGIVAISMFIIALVEILTATGIQTYIAQKRNLDTVHVNSAWTFDLILKSIAFLVISSASLIYISAGSTPSVGWAVLALSTTILIKSLVNPEIHVLKKNLQYGKIAQVDILRKIAAMLITIYIAFEYQTFWAIVIGDIISNFIYLGFSYYICSHRPKATLLNLSEQWNFSKWVMSKGVLGYLRAEADIFIVKSKFGLTNLGGYKVAKELTSIPASDIARPIVEPIVASVSKAISKNDNNSSNRIVLSYILFMSITISPLSTYIFTYSSEVISYVFGTKWAEYGYVLKFLSTILFAFCFNPIFSNTLMAFKKIKMLFYFDLVSFVLVVLPLVIIPLASLKEFTIVRGALAVLSTGILYYLVVKTCGIDKNESLLYLLLPLSISIMLINVFPRMETSSFNYIIPHSLIYFFIATSISIACVLAFSRELRNIAFTYFISKK